MADVFDGLASELFGDARGGVTAYYDVVYWVGYYCFFGGVSGYHSAAYGGSFFCDYSDDVGDVFGTGFRFFRFYFYYYTGFSSNGASEWFDRAFLWFFAVGI